MNNKCCYLQDVLEQAIISEQSGRPLQDLPGMSLQQFPYPCSIDDRYAMIMKKVPKNSSNQLFFTGLYWPFQEPFPYS